MASLDNTHHTDEIPDDVSSNIRRMVRKKKLRSTQSTKEEREEIEFQSVANGRGREIV